ncbi:MAG: LEA type 2 family protein [Bernardetiaceae bacterium]
MKANTNAIRSLIVLLLPFFWACERPQDPQFKTVEDLQVTTLTTEEIVIEGKAIFFNPNAFTVQVTSTKLDVSINDVAVGKVEQNDRTEVTGNSDFAVPLVIRFPPSQVFEDKGLAGGLMNMLFKKKMEVYYKGTVTVAALGIPIEIPVEARKEVKLKKSKDNNES